MVQDSYSRLIAPAIEREIRNALTENAEDGAIQVFGKNLEQLLMQPPIAGQSCSWLGSGIPYWLQTGSCGCDRQGAGYGGHLPDSAAEQSKRSQRSR